MKYLDKFFSSSNNDKNTNNLFLLSLQTLQTPNKMNTYVYIVKIDMIRHGNNQFQYAIIYVNKENWMISFQNKKSDYWG